MRHTAFFVAGFVLLLVQANLFRVLDWVHVPGLVPSLVLPLILFMGVHEYSLAKSAGIAFALGYATDLIGIAPVGLYTFTYTAVFVMTRAVGVRLAAQTMLMQFVLALAFTLLHSLMVLMLLAIFGRDAWIPRTLYPMTIPHVLSTAAISPLVFKLAQRIHTATMSSQRGEAAGGGGPKP
jgi:rod shape-determining protein MreD